MSMQVVALVIAALCLFGIRGEEEKVSRRRRRLRSFVDLSFRNGRWTRCLVRISSRK